MRAYIMKSDADRDLVAAVEALGNHRPFFTARAADMLLDGFVRPHAAPDPEALVRNRLTAREREIVQLLAEGKSSKEVAVSLGISVKTAETHRANIMRKARAAFRLRIGTIRGAKSDYRSLERAVSVTAGGWLIR